LDTAQVNQAQDHAVMDKVRIGLSMWRDRIQSDPKILAGKAVVRGTRIPVDLILEKLGAGESIADVVAAHPRLTADDVHAALTFAAESVRGETVFSVPSEAA
jgi:uncharacterized protein (DUF433 family)